VQMAIEAEVPIKHTYARMHKKKRKEKRGRE
jgi:hypothetical protein